MVWFGSNYGMSRMKTTLNKFGLVAAALGFAFGHTASEFISTVIGDALMPLIEIIFNIGDWQNHTISIGNYSIEWGFILKDFIRLGIITTFAILVLQWLEKPDDE